MSEAKELSEAQKIYNNRQEEIKVALNVNGYDGFIGELDDDIFLLDYWDYEQGINYLIGIAKVVFEEDDDGSAYIKTIHTLNYDFYNETKTPYIVNAFKNILYRLRRIWDSGGHPELNPPRYYIEWAISKKYDIPWLAYAIKKGFYVPKQDDAIKQVTEKPLNVRTENNYLRLIMALANGIKDFNPIKPYEAAQLIIDETGIETIKQQTIADYITKAHALDSKEKD